MDDVAANGIVVRDSTNAGLRALIDKAQLKVALVDYDTRVFYRPQLFARDGWTCGRTAGSRPPWLTAALDGITVDVTLPANTPSDIEVFVHITGGALTEPVVRAVPVARNTNDGSVGLVLGRGDYTVVIFAPGYVTAIDLRKPCPDVDAIRIRHCRLRVLRHGGWSWGADPRRLVEQVTQRLPAWLAQALAEQLADCPPDLTIQQLRLRIPVRMSELRDWPIQLRSAGRRRNGRCSRAARPDNSRRRLAGYSARAAPDQQRTPPHRSAAGGDRRGLSRPRSSTLLTAWQRSGDLPRMLATADGATLRVWARVMLRGARRRRQSPRTASPAASRPLIERMEALLLGDPDDERRVAGAGTRAHRRGTQRAAGRRRGGSVARGSEPRPTATTSEEPPLAASVRPARRRPRDHRPSVMRRRVPPARQARREPVAVESVLPFIVTGILSRRNYFDGLRAALVCSDLLEQSGCFAAALAYKLSPPPNRGWDRSAATRRLAAAMCGLDEPPDNSAMDGFLRGLSTVCAPLDASLWPGNRAVRNQPGILVEKTRWRVVGGARHRLVAAARLVREPRRCPACRRSAARSPVVAGARRRRLRLSRGTGAPQTCARSRSECNRASRAGSAPAIRFPPTSRCCDGAPPSSGASSTKRASCSRSRTRSSSSSGPWCCRRVAQTPGGGILHHAGGVQRAR